VFQFNESEEFPAIVFSSNRIVEWKHNYIYKLSDNEVVSIYVDETENKKKEFELHEHREKLQIAMEAASYYSFEIDLTSITITTHKELYTDLGYKHPEIEDLMQKTGSLIHPEDYKKVKKLIYKHSRNIKPSLNTEFRVKNKNGKWIWFMATGKIIERDKNSKPTRFVGLAKNIQEEKEILFKLQENEEKFKSLATLLPEVIYETDVHGNITFVNLKAFETFEYTSDDLEKGLNITQMLAPEESDRVKENIEKIVDTDNVSGNEYVAITKSGKRFPILVYSNVVRENNIIKGLRGIIINMSELKKAQEQLKISEENFRQLSENINDAFWLRSLENEVIYANPACYKIAGDNFTEIFTDFNAYKEWIHPDDREQIVKQRKKNLKNLDKIHFYEHRIIKPDGDIRWIWIRTFPVFNSKGKLYRRAGIASDISDQKKMLSDLLFAKEKAEESDKLKSAFLANMSHEIRTPMNGILGFAQLLKDRDLTEKEKSDYLKIINSNGKELLNLMNDIIDVAKIEAGQLSINKSIAEINPLLEETYQLFFEIQKRIRKQDIKFILKIPSNEKNLIFTDISRLKQIFNNLLSNAFKFTSAGSIEFGYSIINSNGLSYYQFFVSDTGVGINKDMQEYIFRRFGQAQTKKYKNPQGTGLGLAISKGLIELLNGNIWIESTPEDTSEDSLSGSTFYFTIPIIENIVSVEQNDVELKPKIEMKTLKNATILIVEDNEDNLEFLSRLLIRYEAKIVVAKTGEEAIEIVKSNDEINIVLMDIRLPDIDGFETTQEIKKINPKLPVIAQTAYAMFNDRELCLKNGCDDYISKPLDRDVLFQKINHYIYN
ncbi:PAS domain-containing protein, partial [Bacteroidota bacterium]